MLEYIIVYFETLEKQSKDSEFNDYEGIQQSITLAWNTCQKWYRKTDDSIAWQAAIVLHPRYKWTYFETNWKGPLTLFLTAGKASFKKLWEDRYKGQPSFANSCSTQSPEPMLAATSTETDYLKSILDAAAPYPTTRRAPTIGGRRDQYWYYL